ncbi:hypothetical protein R1sor_011180 [Riccia sorocarpa]|uniref:Uncharacterized protein n=1 Tax=Riccia sorocarpa TaxID=122646 RepID=A0ABD3I1Z6_9MARC
MGGDLRSGVSREGPTGYITWWLRQLGTRCQNLNVRMADPALWKWVNDGKVMEGWDLSSAQWKTLLDKDFQLHVKLNSRWGVAWSRERWRSFWQGRSELFLRDKNLPEDLPFDNLLTFLESATTHQNLRLPMMLLAVAQTRMAWKDRCERVFKGRRFPFPTQRVITSCILIGREIVLGLKPGQKQEELKVGMAYLELMADLESADRRRCDFDTRRLNQLSDSTGELSAPPNSPPTWQDYASNEELGVSTVDLNRPSLKGSDRADQEANLESALENLGFFTTP